MRTVISILALSLIPAAFAAELPNGISLETPMPAAEAQLKAFELDPANSNFRAFKREMIQGDRVFGVSFYGAATRDRVFSGDEHMPYCWLSNETVAPYAPETEEAALYRLFDIADGTPFTSAGWRMGGSNGVDNQFYASGLRVKPGIRFEIAGQGRIDASDLRDCVKWSEPDADGLVECTELGAYKSTTAVYSVPVVPSIAGGAGSVKNLRFSCEQRNTEHRRTVTVGDVLGAPRQTIYLRF